MTQADRVHSTPPTNTSAIDAPQSPGKPHSRRSVLGAIAAIAAGATALTVAPARAVAEPNIASPPSVGRTVSVGAIPCAPADPIYAAIERHKVFALKHAAAWNVRGRFNDCQMNDEQERQLK